MQSHVNLLARTTGARLRSENMVFVSDFTVHVHTASHLAGPFPSPDGSL